MNIRRRQYNTNDESRSLLVNEDGTITTNLYLCLSPPN